LVEFKIEETSRGPQAVSIVVLERAKQSTNPSSRKSG
jgi:hypothetical protein